MSWEPLSSTDLPALLSRPKTSTSWPAASLYLGRMLSAVLAIRKMWRPLPETEISVKAWLALTHRAILVMAMLVVVWLCFRSTSSTTRWPRSGMAAAFCSTRPKYWPWGMASMAQMSSVVNRDSGGVSRATPMEPSRLWGIFLEPSRLKVQKLAAW